MSDAYDRLLERVKDIGRLQAVAQLLGWDQETYMPKEGARARSEQFALINGLAHERLVADETRALLEAVTHPAGDYLAETNIRETRRVFERAAKIPTALVKEIAGTTSIATEVWAAAREESDFGKLQPYLEKLVDLKKQEAEYVGYDTEAYDALMDEYEPGSKASEIEVLLRELREATVTLLNRIKAAERQPDPGILTQHFDVDKQKAWSRKLAKALNFDFKSGRMDTSAHPFCTTIGGCGDVRITSRYQEGFLPAGIFGTIHETGHALYEQGLPGEHAFTPSGFYVSLGVHESQSRMWENLVGRSRPFWSHHWDDLKETFPDAFGAVSLDEFYGAINAVAPSLIRVEADELTYNLHIILRFEIERALFSGSLSVGDMPAAWNEKFEETLGIAPSNDRDGCLQDIHWSWGAFGYFHTYTLGNLYAAQFFEKAKKDIPDLFERIAANDHEPLLQWLRANIHRHGQRYRADELVELVTGEPVSIGPFMDYLTGKFTEIYGL